MKHCLISSTGASRVIIIFAGWGMDCNVFSGISRSGYDVMVVWDYRSFHIDWDCVARYTEVCVLAWSLGVYVASQTTHAIDYKITRRVAVNGTVSPVDDNYGIPEAVFTGTLSGLDERNLRKFQRRMCDSRESFDRFCAVAPRRGVDELACELEKILNSQILSLPPTGRWDLAVIATGDRIFPPINQRRAWQHSGVGIRLVDGGHFVDFQEIINSNFVDKITMASRFHDSGATYARHASVQQEVIDALIESARAEGVFKRMAAETCSVLEIGSGSGMLSERLFDQAPLAHLTLWDLASGVPDSLAGKVKFLQCDAEMAIKTVPDESLNFIFSASTIQWFNSPADFITHCYRVLRRGGYALLTTYTTGNMHQITDITGYSLPLLTPAQLLDMVPQGLEVVYERHYSRDLDFESPLDVLRHLKLTGVNSLGNGDNPATVMNLVRRYPMMLDGLYHLTYCPMILILKKT